MDNLTDAQKAAIAAVRREQSRKYRQTHKAEIAAYKARYRAEHKDAILAYQRKWNRKHPEKVKEYRDRYLLRAAERQGLILPTKGETV